MKRMVEVPIQEEADFEDMDVYEVLRFLTGLRRKYNDLVFRVEYFLESQRLYLADRREETDEEYAARLEREKRQAKNSEESARRQLQRLKESFPQLFQEE